MTSAAENWRKSSYSASNGNCVEWRKSSRSTNNGSCTEVAQQEDAVWVRDSKDPDGPILKLANADWQEFTEGIKRLPIPAR